METIRQMRLSSIAHGVAWVLTCSSFIGCGSIIHGTRQQVSIDTNPPGALVKFTNGTHLTTPQTVELRRSQDHIITIEKDGFEPERLTISRDFNWGATVFGNILWITPGVLVDVLAGGAWTLDPDHIHVDLVPEKPKSPSTVSHTPLQ